MNSDNPEDELLKGDALIRANFQIEPSRLSEEDYPRLLAEALWIETWRLRCKADMLAQLFGDPKHH